MLAVVSFAIVLLVAGTAVCGVVFLAESAWTGGLLASLRNRLLAAGGCVLFLIVVAAAYESKALASPDGHLVARVSGSRGSALTNLMTYVTLLGDSVPSVLIATVLAVIIHRQGVHLYASAILPVVVVAELCVQLGMWKIFNDVTIRTLHPDVPLSGVGQLPSGSVARLLSIFLVAALLWYSYDARGSARIATLGGVLTLVQIVSRLELGRHLFADILAGIVLGLLLTLAVTFIVRVSPRATASPSGSGPDAT